MASREKNKKQVNEWHHSLDELIVVVFAYETSETCCGCETLFALPSHHRARLLHVLSPAWKHAKTMSDRCLLKINHDTSRTSRKIGFGESICVSRRSSETLRCLAARTHGFIMWTAKYLPASRLSEILLLSEVAFFTLSPGSSTS